MEPDTLQLQADFSEVVVPLELRGVSWQQLIDFLRDLETSPSVVRVGRLHLRKDPNNEALLDSTVAISSPKLSRPALATPMAHDPGWQPTDRAAEYE